jgi:plastocyanin
MTFSISFSNRSRFRIAAFSIAVLGLVCGTIAAQAANNPQPALAPPQSEVKIVSTEFKFAIPTQRIVVGQPVTLVLDNSEAESEHAVFFQALGVRLFAQAGEIVRKTIIFDKAGEFAFVCDLPGHREAGMIGKLTVHEEDIGNKNEYPIILGVSN